MLKIFFLVTGLFIEEKIIINMRYIHKFKTDSDFQEEYSGEKYKEPWASWTVENDEVNYNKHPERMITVKTFQWIGEGQLEEVATIEYNGTDVSFEELMEPTFEAHGSRRGIRVEFCYEGDVFPFAHGISCVDFDKSTMGYNTAPVASSKPGEVILGEAGGPPSFEPGPPYDLQNERFADWMAGKTMVIQWGSVFC